MIKNVVIPEFEKFDEDKDNALNIEELKKLMEGLGEPQTHRAVKDMISLVDDDKDGKISFREFLMIFRERLKTNWNLKSLNAFDNLSQ